MTALVLQRLHSARLLSIIPLDGAGLAEASLSKVPLNDSAAAEEDKNKKAFSRPLSRFVVPEHGDAETLPFYQTRKNKSFKT